MAFLPPCFAHLIYNIVSMVIPGNIYIYSLLFYKELTLYLAYLTHYNEGVCTHTDTHMFYSQFSAIAIIIHTYFKVQT